MNLYNFIFCVLYKRDLDRGKSESFSRYDAVLIVAFTLFLHLSLFVSLVKKIFSDRFEELNLSYLLDKDKIIYIIILVGCFFLLIRFYNEIKIEKMIARFDMNVNSSKTSNIIKVLLAIFIPHKRGESKIGGSRKLGFKRWRCNSWR